MNCFRCVLEVLKMMPPNCVLEAASHVCTLWAKASENQELWTEYLETLSVSSPVHLLPNISRKRNYQLQMQSRHKLAVFRDLELVVFNCRTQASRIVPLTTFVPAIHCMSVFVVTGNLLCCGGLDVVSVAGQMELAAVKSAFLIDTETESVAGTAGLLMPRHSHGMLCYEDRALVFGGANERTLRAAEQYSCTTASWASLPDMQFPRMLFNPCAKGAKVYLSGGAERNCMEVFDISTQTYTLLSVSLPASRCWQCTAPGLSQDLIYLAGRSVLLLKLDSSAAVLSKVCPMQCGLQDSAPQVHSECLYYQQCAGIGKLDLHTFNFQLIELPPVQKVRLVLDTKKRKRVPRSPGKNTKKVKLANCKSAFRTSLID